MIVSWYDRLIRLVVVAAALEESRVALEVEGVDWARQRGFGAARRLNSQVSGLGFQVGGGRWEVAGGR
jgi:hypothetical protein